DLPYREYVDHDIELIRKADAIALLPGWDGEGARGSVWERAIGVLLGEQIFDAGSPCAPKATASETILLEAQRLVYGDRQKSYGHPIEDFNRTAIMWSGLFYSKLLPGLGFAPEDVALAM